MNFINFCFLFISLFFKLISSDNKINCDFAISNCVKKTTCSLAIHDFRISCRKEFHGLVHECSQLCQTSIITLLASDEGNQYLNCDCVNNTFCKLYQKRIQICDQSSKNISSFDTNYLRNYENSCFVNQLFCISNPICNVKYQKYRYL